MENKAFPPETLRQDKMKKDTQEENVARRAGKHATAENIKKGRSGK